MRGELYRKLRIEKQQQQKNYLQLPNRLMLIDKSAPLGYTPNRCNLHLI